MKFRFGNIKIGTRLALGFSLIIILSIVIGTVAIMKLHKLGKVTENIYEHPLKVSNAVRDIKSNIIAMHSSMKDVALAENISKIDIAASFVLQFEQKVYEGFKIVFERFLGDKRDIEKVFKSFKNWKIIRDEVISLSKKGKKLEAADITRRKGAKHVNLMTAKIQVMIDFANKKGDEFLEESKLQQKKVITTMLVLILIIFLAGIIISILITISISKPLSSITKSIRQISIGYLHEKVLIDQKDQIGQLADSFRALQKDLLLKSDLANRIASGNFNNESPPRSDEDELGKSFYAMTSTLKQLTDDLKGSESKYGNLLKNLPIGIFVTTHEGKILSANPAALKMFAIETEDEFINYPVSQYYYEPTDRRKFIKILKKKGYVKNYELKVKRKDGSSFWGSVNTILGISTQNESIFINSFVDITQSVFKDQAMKTSIERFKMLFNGATDAIYIYTLGSENELGTFIEVNDIACKSMGYTRGELLQMSPLDIVIADKGIIAERTTDVLSNRSIRFETIHRTKNGRIIPVEVSSILAEIEGKSTVMSIVRDITLRKEYDEKLKKSRDDAEEANRIKSIFLANMSHEIRTPMNGIIGMTDLVLKTDLTDKQQNYINIVKKSADALMSIINDILDFSKIESGKIRFEKVSFNIKTTIKSGLQSLKAIWKKKNIKVYQNIQDDIPDYLSGDPLRLNQIIINLVGNSIKFTDIGEVDFNIRIKSKNDKNICLEFSVKDTGIGIPLDKHDMIFDPFSQSENSYTRSYGGSGLGLSITKQLIESMGGKIRLESEEGKGSTFTFTINFEIPDQQPFEMVSEKKKLVEIDKKEIKKNLHILLAEDNLVNQEIAMEFLKLRGYSVTIAQTGSEAVKFAKSKIFDCILMDVQMPDMNGVEATDLIRKCEKEHGGHIPIIAMTAYAREGEKEQFLKAGMDDYISKPFNENELFIKIESLYEKFRLGLAYK